MQTTGDWPRHTVAPGEEIAAGDLVRLNDRGEIEKAAPNALDALGSLPASTTFQSGYALVPSWWRPARVYDRTTES